jgi:hypothetical protein
VSVCTNLGTDQAWLLFQILEALGFAPDASTLEIFIFHSCRETKLKSAHVYLSECFSRHIKINSMELKEIPLIGRKFTWSNQ